MPMTVQEISDRFEITDVLTDYCSAVDTKTLMLLTLFLLKMLALTIQRQADPEQI